MLDISIVTFNSSKWLNAYFESLIEQDYPISQINIYITDNGSNDDTVSVCKTFADRNLFADFNIDIKDNLGFGCGHNNNFKKCKSEFVLVTNVDLTYEKSSIASLVNFASEDSEEIASWEMRQKPFEHPKNYNPITLETSWSSSACVLLRKIAIDKIGGYEPKIFMYGEDVELSWRLRANGYKLKYYPKSVCWHYTYEESKFKKNQFLGSTLANLYLRARYGSIEDVKQGEAAYQNLIDSQEQYTGQHNDLIKNFKIYKDEFDYFRDANLNKHNVAKFINTWDYEINRDGAFYECKEFPPETPLVSVLIRTYQGRRIFLGDAIKSVLKQTYKNFEIIIVEDGGSTQLDFVSSFNDNRIKYFSADKVGRCVTGNISLEKSSGKYCIFLDDDDYFYCDHLEVLVSELFSSNEIIKASYSNAFEIATTVTRVSNEVVGYNDEKLTLIPDHLQDFDRTKLWFRNFIPIQTILFERSLFEELGGFDLELDNLEDWNLWTRYSCVCNFKYISKTTSVYRVPSNHEENFNRKEVLHSFYQAALNKQSEMIVNLPLTVLVEGFNESNFNNSITSEYNKITSSRTWRYACYAHEIMNKYKLRRIIIFITKLLRK